MLAFLTHKQTHGQLFFCCCCWQFTLSKERRHIFKDSFGGMLIAPLFPAFAIDWPLPLIGSSAQRNQCLNEEWLWLDQMQSGEHEMGTLILPLFTIDDFAIKFVHLDFEIGIYLRNGDSEMLFNICQELLIVIPGAASTLSGQSGVVAVSTPRLAPLTMVPDLEDQTCCHTCSPVYKHVAHLFLGSRDQRDGQTHAFSSANSTDTMDIIGFIIRQTHVDHVRHSFDINASGSHISANQKVGLFILKRWKTETALLT